ncbi:MAG: hypothetical protein ABI432_03295 [Flavobacteriales bacterium]
MTEHGKLIAIKIVHTAVWVFFNVVMGYLVYAVLQDRIDQWVWLGLAAIAIECAVLLIFGMACPLTVVARRYSASRKPNFDIFLPLWLAKFNKLIYGVLLLVIITGLAWRGMQ